MLISLKDQMNLEYIVSVVNKNKMGTITVIKGFDTKGRAGSYGIVVVDDFGQMLSDVLEGPEEKITYLFDCLAWDEKKQEIVIVEQHEEELQ